MIGRLPTSILLKMRSFYLRLLMLNVCKGKFCHIQQAKFSLPNQLSIPLARISKGKMYTYISYKRSKKNKKNTLFFIYTFSYGSITPDWQSGDAGSIPVGNTICRIFTCGISVYSGLLYISLPKFRTKKTNIKNIFFLLH